MARGVKKPRPAAAPGPRRAGVAAAAVAVAAICAWFLLSRTREHELRAGPLEPVECTPSRVRALQRGCGAAAARCGRMVVDNFASASEVDAMLAIAARGMALGGGAGGPTILDLQSGALSRGDKFVDVWMMFNLTRRPPLTRADVAVYAELADRVRELAMRTFGLPRLWLTSPTFFARISADKAPRIENDEYWHEHVDAVQYGSFAYTSLLYLSDADADFTGGRLTFAPSAGRPAAHVSPTRGRLVLFSSGEEMPHLVERVASGVRIAVTIAFTCNREAAITDFLSQAAPTDGADDE